jgi:hypothetical protein
MLQEATALDLPHAPYGFDLPEEFPPALYDVTP